MYPVDFQERTLSYLHEIAMDKGLSPDVEVKLERDKQMAHGRFYLQCIAPDRFDVDDRGMSAGHGGKLYLSPFAIESEIVQASFGLIKGYFEHEVREHFRYKGKRVYGPHLDINALLEIADRTAARK
jgi:hypothetical protein